MIPSEISPAFLFVVAILSAAAFLCGFLHLLCRILHKNRGSGSSLASEELDDDPEMARPNPFQRQLQQLFRLHDSGLDQAFVDALPVFLYKDIVKGEEHFDCAVCLCEFFEQDKLRLLPPCGHAFHIDCIDTWLLSNSTCPLCRGSLSCSLGFRLENPVSEFDDRGEDDGDGCSGVGDCRIVVSSKRVFSVRLGKLRGIPEGSDRGGLEISMEETSSSSSLDARRCYSMGSYRYVVSETELRVETCAAEIGNGEGDQHSEGFTRRKFLEPGSGFEDREAEGMRIGVGSRGESFSVSKIWQWSNKKRNSKLTNISADSRANQ